MRKRKIDLNSYLPQVVGDAREVKEMNRVEDIELEEVWDHTEKLFYNRWILTADEDGLERYEKLLGIKPTGDIFERRREAWYEWNRYVIYTDRSVRKLMSLLLSEDGFEMDIFYNRYVVRFVVYVDEYVADLRMIYRKLRTIIPANMGIEIGVQTNDTLNIEPEYWQYKFKYIHCDETLCGLFPYPATRGVVFQSSLGIQNRADLRFQRLRMTSPRSNVQKELIYPTEARERTYIFDGGDAETLPDMTKIVESGRMF